MTTTALAPDSAYIPALDGLRAVAILLVIAAHFGPRTIVPGGFGVTLFFFISGLIISRVLLAETRASDSLSLRNFYLRRALRLVPPLVVMILLTSLFSRILEIPLHPPEYPAALLYYANYYQIWGGFPNSDQHPFTILWSLAVEEHFYLIFPVLLALMWTRPKVTLAVVGGLSLTVLLWRISLYSLCSDHAAAVCGQDLQNRFYMASDTRIDSILYGVLLTLLMATSGRFNLRWLSSWPCLSVAAVFLLCSFAIRDPQYRETWRYSMQGLALLSLMATILFTGRGVVVRQLLEHPVLVLIGRWSYSLYLYHWLAMVVTDHTIATRFSITWEVMAVGLTVIFSLGSYYGLELPCQRWRRRLAGHRASATSLAPAAPRPLISS